MNLKKLNEDLKVFLERGGSDYGTMKDNFDTYLADENLKGNLDDTLKLFRALAGVYLSLDNEASLAFDIQDNNLTKKDRKILGATLNTLFNILESNKNKKFLSALEDLMGYKNLDKLFDLPSERRNEYAVKTPEELVGVIKDELPEIIASSKNTFKRFISNMESKNDGPFKANKKIAIKKLENAFNSDVNEIERIVKMVSEEWPNGYGTINKVDPLLDKLMNCKPFTYFSKDELGGKTIAEIVVPKIKLGILAVEDLEHLLTLDGGNRNTLFPSNWNVKKFGEYPKALAQALVNYNRIHQEEVDIFTDVYNVYYANRDKEAFADALKIWKDDIVSNNIYIYDEIDDDEVAAQMYKFLQQYEPELTNTVFGYMPDEQVEEIQQNWENN